MGRNIQLRKVDHEDYLTLRSRAAAEGLSLNAYLKRELHRLAIIPSIAEPVARADRREST